MTQRPAFERKSVAWVLARTRSVFASVIERRLAAGERASARVFKVDGSPFAEVAFETDHPNLVLQLEARR